MEKLATQMDSFDSLVNSPILGKRHREVMEQFKKYTSRGLTLFELVELLNWPVNSVSGRVTELRTKGYLKASTETRVNPVTNKSATVWKLGEVFEKPFGED